MASAALNPERFLSAQLRYIEFVVCHFFPGPAVIFLSLAMFSRSMPITLAFFFDWQFLKALMKTESLFQFFSFYRDPKLLLLLEVVAENLIFDWQ